MAQSLGAPYIFAMSQLEVFYDGACPLCRREIALMRRMDRRGRVAFIDVSSPDAAESCPIEREALLARFHLRNHKGELLSGAGAFTAVYAELTGLRPIAKLGEFGPTRRVLDGLYGLFLRVRPQLQRLLSADRRGAQ